MHFLHFGFPASPIAAWKSGDGTAMLVIDRPNCGHAALIGPDAREFLAAECF